MCVCGWVVVLRVWFFTYTCPNLQEVCINIMYFFNLWCRILPKCQWRSVWVSLPNQQLPLKKYAFTHCWQLLIFFWNFSPFKSRKWYFYDFYFSLQVFSTSVGLTKTVYNPAALKAAQKTSEEALKKKQVRRNGGNSEKGGWKKIEASNKDSHTKNRR